MGTLQEHPFTFMISRFFLVKMRNVSGCFREKYTFYNNINSQLDATIIILLIISISSTCFGRNYHPKHVELIDIINKIIIFASSWLFILLYQRCTVTQTSNTLFTFNNVFRKSCLLRENVEKLCRDGQPAYDNTERRICIACWVPKATDTHSV